MAITRLCSISLFLIIGGWIVVAQNSGPGIPRGLQECYENDTLYDRPLRIPATIGALTALIDRVERIPGLNMDMRKLSESLVHRFRTDGVERDPTVMESTGVIPFTTSGYQNNRYRLFIEKLLPGNANTFPNSSLSGEERCALHFMTSTTVDAWERGDEGSVCSRLQNFRSFRAPRDVHDHDEDDSVVDMFAGEDEMISGDGQAAKQNMYPPESQCPIEDGVVWTPWGSVSASALMAGIAAGFQPQEVNVNQMGFQNRGSQGVSSTLENVGPISNIYAGTFAGDLGEVVLQQGPRSTGQMNIGGPGGWNDTAMPKHYFLSKNEHYELSDAEIRGGLDGLILGKTLPDIQSSFGSKFTLSQAIDMYYSERGFPNQRTVRACQRREHLSKVAPSETLVTQTRNLIPALQYYMSVPVIKEEIMEQYINNAVTRLLSYIPASLNDKACEMQAESPVVTERLSTPALDLYIIVDPTWNYDDALPTLSALLREIPPHAIGSSLTMYVGSQNEMPMVNFTRSILDFYGNFTADNYRMYTSTQLDVARALAKLRGIFSERREEEKKANKAGGRSQAVLFIAHTATGATDDQSKKYLQNEARVFRESNPDVRLLFLCSGNKERFRDVVIDPDRDLFTLAPAGYTGTPEVKDIVKRLSELPARLTNPTCGAKWTGNENNNGGGQEMMMYADPTGMKYYRLMPNYFFHTNLVKVKFQGQGQGRITVCYSRTKEFPMILGDPGQGGSSSNGVTCRQINSDSTEFRVENPCDGAPYAIDCKPLYFSAVAVESTNRCSTPTNHEDGCRYPDLARITVTANGLGCHSGAGLPAVTSAILLAVCSLIALLRRS